MAHTWKLAIGLGLLSAALAAGCVVKDGDDDDDGGASGEGGSSGSGGSTGGSSAKGGSAGSTAGKGGSAGSGTAGKGGSAGTGGSTGGTGGSGVGGTTSEGGGAGVGEGGTAGTELVATCDPADGELDSTPYPNCDADPADDDCQVCIQESCCEFSKKCYGTDPNNVCGWGGPEDGKYAGMTEIGCFHACLADKTLEAGECLADDAETCAADCATTMCFEGAGQIALVGNATNELATCMQDNCADKCFGAETCGN